MKNINVINGMMAVFIVLPIWFFLLHQILTAINASELAWFLYYIYLPAGFFTNFVGNLLKE